MLIDPRYTSQKCSVCGEIRKSNRKGNSFWCQECGFSSHADLNAARNIAQLGKSKLSRLSVNQPEVTSNEVKGHQAIATKGSYKPPNSLSDS